MCKYSRLQKKGTCFDNVLAEWRVFIGEEGSGGGACEVQKSDHEVHKTSKTKKKKPVQKGHFTPSA